jgi:capsular exopolysaccharide synthesis family protein
VKKPVYESVARLQIDPNRSSNLGLDEMLSQKLETSDTDSRILTEVQILQSDTVAMRVIDNLGLAKNGAFAGKDATRMSVTNPRAMSPGDREHLLGIFQKNLIVQNVLNTQLVEVRFRSTDPKLATDVANAVVDQYMQRNLQSRYDGTTQVSNWLSKQLEELQNKSAEAQRRLSEFQKQNNILGTDENDNIAIDRLKLLNNQLAEAESDRIVKEARYRLAVTGNPELIAAVVPSTTLQSLRTQETELKAELAQLNAKFGGGYPKVRELQAQLAQLDANIAEEVTNVGKRLEDEYLSAQKTESLLRDEFNKQKAEAFQLNDHAVQFAVLKHDVDNGQELYDTLQLKLKMAGVTAGLSSNYISVVDRAEIPHYPVRPRVALNLCIGLFGGVLSGLLLAFLIESLDDTLSSSEELESCVKVPVLCSIPMNGSANGRQVSSTDAVKSLPILLSNSNSPAAEAFRSLRSSLLLSSPDRQPRVITIVSSLPGEGKTTTSINLAISFAQRGESVLLLDADLRRSTMQAQFGLHEKSPYGISTILTQGMDDRAILKPVEAYPNLQLVSAGPHPPNPAELLGSKRMLELLEVFSSQFDRIIIDTPPVLSVSDSLALANVADAVVVVVRSEVSRKKAVLRARSLLTRANSNLVGIVFNGVNPRLEQYYYERGVYGKLANYYAVSDD